MKTVWIVVGLLIGASPGCATTRVGTDRDSNVNFAWYRTFTIQTGQVVNNGIPDPRDSLVQTRVGAAISYELQLKGLTPVVERPDLIVTYTADTHESDLSLNGNPLNGYTALPNELPWTPAYRQGRVIIDVFDSITRKLVWRSIATAYDKDFRSAEFIGKAVDEALEKYPTWVHPS